MLQHRAGGTGQQRNDHRQGEESVPAAFCGFIAVVAGEGWNSVLPSTFNNMHEGFSIPPSRINSTVEPFLEGLNRSERAKKGEKAEASPQLLTSSGVTGLT